jgi:spore maturation protein CgeB
MRILIADTYYEPFLEQHYRENPGLQKQAYDKQLSSLLARCFGTGDAYSRNLRLLGHEAADLVVNCEPLQSRWEMEQRGAGGRAIRRLLGARASSDLDSIALAQIESFEPDILYVQNLWFFSRPNLDAIRSRGVSVVGQIASEPPPDQVVTGYDLILTSFPHYVERFEALGVPSRQLDIAFDELVIDRLQQAGIDTTPGSERPHPLSFVGGVDPRVHPGRVSLLERICAETGLEVWGYGADQLPQGSPIRSAYHGPAWGLDTYRILADSQIAINTHIEAAEGHANNMRLYEATGCGALLLTDEAADLSRLFEPGGELVTYSSGDHLIEKVRHYLDRPAERERIAANGQRRTLSEHTYRRRIAQLVELLDPVRT